MFKYFQDPQNYAYLEESVSKCCICDAPDAVLYSIVTDEFDCCCTSCLLDGRLIESKTWINDCDTANEDSDIIMYQTPPLPTWQDLDWPVINGSFGVFVKLASKPDFNNSIETFRRCALSEHVDPLQIQELWEVLPDQKISSLKDGNFDTSFYLFEKNENLYWLWDAN